MINPGSLQLPLFGDTSASEKNPDAPGVYIIRNLANNHFYIGSTVNLRKRWLQHEWSLKNNRHHNPHMQAAWNLYGSQSFRLEVLEIVSAPSELISVEQKWINAFDAARRRDCYNILPTAGTTAGRIVREETRQKMSIALRGRVILPESREKMRQAKLGGKHSPEHIEKVRQTSLGRKYGPRSEEFKQRFRALSVEQIAELKRLRREGWTFPALAQRFGIALSTTQRIVSGESCKGVGDE